MVIFTLTCGLSYSGYCNVESSVSGANTIKVCFDSANNPRG